MGIRQIEKAIVEEAKIVLNNPKMKLKALLEWSTGQIKPEDGEIVVFLPQYQVNIAIKSEIDKR